MRWRLLRRCLLLGLLGLVTSVAVAWGAAAYHQLAPQKPERVGVGVAVVGDAIVRLEVDRRPALLSERWELQDTVNEGPRRDYHRVTAQLIVEIGGAAYDDWYSSMLSRLFEEPGAGPALAPPPSYRIDDLAARGVPAPAANIANIETSVWRTSTGWPLLALCSGGRRDIQDPDPGGLPVNPYAVQTSEHGTLDALWPWGAALVNAGPADSIRLPVEPRPGLAVNTIFYALLWGGLLLGPGAIRRAHRRARGRCPKCGYSLRGQPAPGCPECGSGRDATASPEPHSPPTAADL